MSCGCEPTTEPVARTERRRATAPGPRPQRRTPRETCLRPAASRPNRLRSDGTASVRLTQSRNPLPTGSDLIPTPYGKDAVRHLAYHIWPVRGTGVWQSNVEQLKKRMHLFNGRRRIGIAIDEQSDSPEAVRDSLAGFDCEFIEISNTPALREVATFVPLLEPLASTAANEIVFYAHAKGVRHSANIEKHTPVHRWTEAMYEVCLEAIGDVEQALVNHAFAGCFRRRNRFGFSGGWPWHYSGTFWWFRSAFVFSNNWRTVSASRRFAWAGVEGWPGLHVPANDAACLLGDNAGDLYQERTWVSVQKELDAWKSIHSVIA